MGASKPELFELLGLAAGHDTHGKSGNVPFCHRILDLPGKQCAINGLHDLLPAVPPDNAGPRALGLLNGMFKGTSPNHGFLFAGDR